MVLELRPSHDPDEDLRLCGRRHLAERSVELDLALAPRRRSVGGRRRSSRSRRSRPIPRQLPDMLKGFSAVPPLLSDIDLSLDDRYLYASCWGTGEMRQYDVSDPFDPKLVGSVHIGGIVRRAPPSVGSRTSRSTAARRWSRSAATAQRVYFTNSLYRSVGRSVLSGRHRQLDGEARRQARRRRLRFDSKFFVRVRRGASRRTKSACRAATRRRTRTAIPREPAGRWSSSDALRRR